jgi:hypothetical protein
MRSKEWRSVVAVALTCLGLSTVGAGSAVAAAPADLDQEFGHRGFSRISLVLDPSSREERAVDVAVGPRDEAFVLDELCPTRFACSFAVTRYDDAGRRDRSYGLDGGSVVTTQMVPTPAATLPRAAIEVDGYGHVFIATSNGGNVVLFGLTPAGAPDPGFGVAGRVEADLGHAGS